MNENKKLILLRDAGGTLYGICRVDKDADVEGAIARAKELDNWSTEDIYKELNCDPWDYEEFWGYEEFYI